LANNKIHVVSVSRSPKSTRKESAERSNDFTNYADKLKVQAVRQQLEDALDELDDLDFELEGGCNW